MAESSMTSQKAVENTVCMEISTKEIQGAEWMYKSTHEEKYFHATCQVFGDVAKMDHFE